MRGVLAAAAGLLILLVAACGDDDGGAAPTTTAGAQTPTATATLPPAPTAPPGETPQPTQPPDEGDVGGGFDSTDLRLVSPDPDPPAGVAVLTDVRIGEHDEEGGFDRIVFEFEGALPAGQIEYIEEAIGCGTGDPIAVEGDAVLQVRLQPAVAHDDAGMLTIDSTKLAGTDESIFEAVLTCDFEADVTWAIGVVEAKRFRVVTLSNPTRLVIDIQH